MNKTDLSKYNNDSYKPGKNSLIRLFWYYTNLLFFKNPFNTLNFTKTFLLKLYGAKVGKGVVIKPSVNIKYPWRLKIGNYVWIGENVWIDNLDDVEIGDNVCISQGAMLLTGSHDYTKVSFDVIIGKIVLEDGVWIGAKSVVYPNIICKSHSILGVNSVATKNLDSYFIYHGNPAVKISKREIKL
ncbi:MAG: WcaF family extracellular polysaccharide biosynthesis acetyltransferase [Bacteroidales bacterium]|nr:WcaF family extracellular polysaccharide biosynthesis acetyltransferase [Bacteroidales bacterium]